MRRLVVAMVASSVLLTGCTGDDGSGGPTGSQAQSSAYRLVGHCPKPTKVSGIRVDQLNKYVAHADLPGWQAADIGASARLSDGRLVWLFGDTVRTDRYRPTIVGNSMLITSGLCATQLMAANNGPVIPDSSPGVVLWPMSVVVLEPPKRLAAQGVHDVLVVLCARTGRGKGQMDFTYFGSSAALFSVKPQQAPQLLRVTALTPDNAAIGQVNWGAAATLHGRWLYVYGTRRKGQEFGRELYVGRAPVANPGDRGRWQFWDGSEWQSEIGRSAAILPAHGGVSQTLSVDVIDGRFVAVSKRDGDLGDFVYQWDARHPAGPWTPVRGVPAPDGSRSGELKYAPLAHPEIALADGNLLVSISRNTTDFESLLANPEIGRPVFAEVARP